LILLFLLQRAIARNQEGLSEREIIRDYNTIYFPAQNIHFERDDPKAVATWVVQSSDA
jgi:uridine kinase